MFHKISERKKKRRRRFLEEALDHIDLLYNIALRVAKDPQDAERMVQDTYLRAYSSLTNPENIASRAWLIRMLRSDPRYRGQKLPPEAERPKLQLGEEVGVCERFPSEDTTSTDISESLNSLPLEFREALILSDVDGFSYKEMAKILGKSEEAVRISVQRGRQLLRSSLLERSRAEDRDCKIVNECTHQGKER
ncbi:MAG: RNA polymerase sigma factor [bacterium]